MTIEKLIEYCERQSKEHPSKVCSSTEKVHQDMLETIYEDAGLIGLSKTGIRFLEIPMYDDIRIEDPGNLYGQTDMVYFDEKEGLYFIELKLSTLHRRIALKQLRKSFYYFSQHFDVCGKAMRVIPHPRKRRFCTLIKRPLDICYSRRCSSCKSKTI